MTRRAVLRADAENTGELRRLLERAQRLADEGVAQWDEFLQVDKKIHLALAAVGGDSLHYFFLETVHNHLHRYHINAFLPRTDQTIRTTLAELKKIVAAVLRGEADRAERLARDHVRHATAAMEKMSSTAAKSAKPIKRFSRSKTGHPETIHDHRRH